MFGDDWSQEPSTPRPGARVSEDRRALYLRWRPTCFADVVGQDHVTRTLRNAVMRGRLAHAYLFTGPRGTGKTSVARILYRAATCANLREGDPCNECPTCVAALENRSMDLVEIDAASNRGIDDIRDLRERVAYRPSEGRYRVYIVDEAHELTAPAWDAFLKTLEEPPEHAIFVLATTEAHKVPATIVSRCQRFDFRRIPFDATRDQLARVTEAEGLDIEPAVLERLARAARGGLRDALGLLDQLSAFAGGRVDMEVARAALGLPAAESVRGLLEALGRGDAADTATRLGEVAEGGSDLRQFVEEVVSYLRGVLLARAGADAPLAADFAAEDLAWLRREADQWAVGALLALVQELSIALARTRDAQQFQTQVEVALLTACLGATPLPATQAVTRAAPPRQARVSPPPPSGVPSNPVAPLEPSREPEPAAGGTPSGRLMAESASAYATVVVEDPGDSREDPTAETDVTPESVSTPAASTDRVAELAMLKERWTDVFERARAFGPWLSGVVSNAQPVDIDGDLLIVSVGAERDRVRLESPAKRTMLLEAVKFAVGRQYRLRCVVADEEGVSLLNDPVIKFAAKTFGGQPRRVRDG